MAEIKAALTKRDQIFLDQSLNGSMWRVILQVGTPLALYQGLNQFFTILDTMMASRRYGRVIKAFVSVLSVNMILGAVISGLELWQLDWLARFFDSGNADFHREIVGVYRYEALGAVPLGVNAAVLALLFGLGKTKLTLLLNFARLFLFRIPVFWFLQNYTTLGPASVGAVMLVSNFASGILAAVVGVIVILQFRKRYLMTEQDPSFI